VAFVVGRYRAAETRELRERLIRQGRGQGHGAAYQPWIRLGEFPNRGNSFRVQSPLTGRTHHYLSNLEYRHHLLCEYLGNVIDIREQYPIHPITETLALAHELGIAHPEFGGHICSLTTDSLLTIDDGDTRRQLARSLKYTSDLTDGRTLEKLELERQAWLVRGTTWELLTEHDLPDVLGLNLRWLRGWNRDGRGTPSAALQQYYLGALAEQSISKPLGSILDLVADRLRVARFMSIHIFRYLAWQRVLEVDLYVPLHLTRPHPALASNFRKIAA
jgi:hypothetical protein